MFESFFSNITSTLGTVFAIVVVIILVYIFCMCALYFKHDFLLYYMLRDQVRFMHWLLRSTYNFLRNHWRFVLTILSFSGLYLVFYSALPGWTEVHTVQKHLVSLFSSTMITATVVVLAKRKMKWSLRLAPISTVSITAIIVFYLYAESIYLVPNLNVQPFPFEIVALVLIPSIIGIALLNKLYWLMKTRHQSNEAYLNPQGTINGNSHSHSANPQYPSNPRANNYRSAIFQRENRGLEKIEKAYGISSRREDTSQPSDDDLGDESGFEVNSGSQNVEDSELRQLLESEKNRVEKNFRKPFSENQRNKGLKRKTKG